MYLRLKMLPDILVGDLVLMAPADWLWSEDIQVLISELKPILLEGPENRGAGSYEDDESKEKGLYTG